MCFLTVFSKRVVKIDCISVCSSGMFYLEGDNPRIAYSSAIVQYTVWFYHLVMPRCACASEVYGSVFVCLCVCVCRLLQLLKDESSASKSFYMLLLMFSWILIRGFAK